MKLSSELVKLLAQVYPPDSMVDRKFKGLDLAFKTNADGEAVLLFIGKRDDTGNIIGSRYARTLKKDQEGKIFKDHWELKGKAT